jgi:hypothetical protein
MRGMPPEEPRQVRIVGTKKQIFMAAAIALVLMVVSAIVCSRIDAGSSAGNVSIAVNKGISLNGLSMEEVFALRKSEVAKHMDLGIFPRNYAPSQRVFGQMQPRAGWVKDVQFIVGNPYLLVLNSSHPYVNVLAPYCGVDEVTFAGGKIIEAYRGEVARKWFFYIYDYYKKNKEIIRLWLSNAYDAGFRYAHIDAARSFNLDFTWRNSPDSLVGGIYSGNEFFHVGHLGKNNISPYDERATIRLQRRDVDTVVYIKLWKDKPPSPDSKEDLAYVIRMEP